MLYSVSTRAKFLIAALIFFLLSILLALIMPFAISETIYNRSEHLVLAIPYSNFRYFVYSLITIMLCIILLAFNRSIVAIIAAVSITIAAIIISGYALTGYISIQEESLTVKELWHTEKLHWNELTEIIFAYESGNQGEYIFTFEDGSEYVLPHSGSIGVAGKSAIYSQSQAYGIPFRERPKE